MIAFLLIGLVVGVLARTLRGGLRDPGVTMTVAAGVVGALVGGAVTNLVMGEGVNTLAIAPAIGALLVAMAVVGVLESRSPQRS